MSTATGTGPVTDYARTAIERTQGRSMVMSTRGVVAAEHPAAALAGATVLARGGHAVDAAIAANAVMGVVAPMMNGLGGDLFAIVRDARDGSIHGVNASGWSPAVLTIERLNAAGHSRMPQEGAEAVTVPGAVAGWTLLHERFGRTPLSGVLAPAAQIADEGFPVTELAGAEWAAAEGLLRKQRAATFLPGGRVPAVGEVFRNADLARTLRLVGAGGREAFYTGVVADAIVAACTANGGAMAKADLAEFAAEWVEPLSTTYRGWTVYELPPNGQGIAALMMLNLLEQFPMTRYGHHSAEALHVLIEAKKLAYADMVRFLADPRFARIPVADMLSKDYAARRARLIDPRGAAAETASGLVPEQGSDTTYLSAVDRDGNMVSLIQSNFANFGSGLVPDGLGFALQNRGGLFSLDPIHPNALAPRKRPLHTIIPGLMTKETTSVAFGIMGGWNQSQAHAQFISNVVDYGLNIQAALEAPRFTKLTFDGRDVIVEDRVPAGVRASLAALGHELNVRPGFSSLMGGGQSVMHDAATGVSAGASDPRKDGAAVPEPLL